MRARLVVIQKSLPHIVVMLSFARLWQRLGMSLRIAHLSDLHLLPSGWIGARSFLGRRAFGTANLLLARRHLHSEAVARAAVDAVMGANIDHCVVTGDVCNLALDAEFALAAEVLSPLAGRMTVIPGNHDYYTPGAMRTDPFGRHFGVAEYPRVVDLGDVRLIGLRSPTRVPPMCAFGRVGETQRSALVGRIREADGRFVIVALHHNLHRRPWLSDTTGRLLDRDALADTLRANPPGLVIHGHDHHEHEMCLAPNGGIPVIGCGSTSILDPSRARLGRFNVYTINAGRLDIERWQYHPQSGGFRCSMA